MVSVCVVVKWKNKKMVRNTFHSSYFNGIHNLFKQSSKVSF